MKTKDQLFDEMYDYLNELGSQQGSNIELKLDKLLTEIMRLEE